MKKIFLIFAIVAVLFTVPVFATETTEVIETELATVVVTEVETEVEIDIKEVHDIVVQASSFSEAVVAIAEKFDITIAEAEELVSDIKELGDKYLGGTELWEIIKNDMTVHPAKHLVIAQCFLIFAALIAFILRWIISNMGQMRAMKLNLASLKKSVDGDDSEEGKAFSLRGLITAKNDEIKALEEKDSAIESEVIKLREQAERLTQSAEEVLNNSKSALKITQEIAIQIAQLLCIAMEKGKMPVLSSEARRIWFENTQANILGVTEGNEDGSKADEDIQEV
jgi:peptidoglycan hydrolase CwlO-like protein